MAVGEFKRPLWASAISTSSELLGYTTTTGPDACTDFGTSPITRYYPSGQSFLTTTTLYQNAAGTTPAQAGFYSDGAKWRYWDETSFTSTGFC